MPDFVRKIYSDTNLQTLVSTGAVSSIDRTSAAAESVKFSGHIQFIYAQTYTISVLTTGGVRLLFNNAIQFDEWDNDSVGVTTYSFTYTATAGEVAALIAEFSAPGASDTFQVKWQSSSQALQLIPAGDQYANNEDPVAVFFVQPSGLTVYVETMASYDPDGDSHRLTRVINWGDGNIETLASGVTKAKHTYASGATRTITLTVTDEGGASDSYGVSVTTPSTQIKGVYDNYGQNGDGSGRAALPSNYPTTIPTPTNATDYYFDTMSASCRPRWPVCGGPGTRSLGIPEPLKVIPQDLRDHKKQATQTTCWCWAIKPVAGEWEFYTSLDAELELPEYEDELGNVVPTGTYLSTSGVSPTAIPTRLNLGKDGVDVSILQFDRSKLLANFYAGAGFEVFELNYEGDLSERYVALSGQLGNAKVSDYSATIELVAWPDLLNREVGREINVLCDVGALLIPQIDGTFKRESFGAGRCRNLELLDGPDRDDWTSVATVTAVGDNSVFQCSYNTTTAYSGDPLSANWKNHLAEGQVLFTSGDNDSFECDIKAGAEVSAGVLRIVLHNPLPFTPQVGDTLRVTSGCRKTLEDCIFYGNVLNYQGFPYLPGREGVMNKRRSN